MAQSPKLRWRFVFLALGALLPSLGGCLRRETPADLVIVNGNEPESLDPAIVTGVSEMRVTKALFEGLLRLEATNARPVAALAEKWEISADAKLYTFHLRNNLTWSTGDPITTADVVYSWLRALSIRHRGRLRRGSFFTSRTLNRFILARSRIPPRSASVL